MENNKNSLKEEQASVVVKVVRCECKCRKKSFPVIDFITPITLKIIKILIYIHFDIITSPYSYIIGFIKPIFGLD